MEDTRAKRYIKQYEREDALDSNFKNLWQDVADLTLPRMNQIIKTSAPGQNHQEEIFSTVAQEAAEDGASGLAGMMVPNGEVFFDVKLSDSSRMTPRVQRYLGFLAERGHEHTFSTNFISQFNEAVLSTFVFGPSNLYSEFDIELNQMNYLAFDVGTYTIMLDSRMRVMGVMVKWKIPAIEAFQRFGDNTGKNVTEAALTPEKEMTPFEFLHVVEKRNGITPQYSGLSKSMPWSSCWVNMKDQLICNEGGFTDNPYSVAHWRKAMTEKWGRGRGVMAFPAVRQLQQMELDFTEFGNKLNNPPMEVLESFDGKVKKTPGAENRVSELNSIRDLTQQSASYPYAKDAFERKVEEVKDKFMGKVFRQFMDLSGDRRTTLEIRERKNQAIRMVGSPILNIYNNLLAPTITRTLLLMIRHGKIIFEGSPNPPDELAGVNFGLEFQGELALALRDQQARGFIDWTGFLGQMAAVFPDENIQDYIAINRAIPRMGRAFGASMEDFATEEEIAEKQMARQQAMEAQMAAQAAQVAADAYKKTSGAAEDGSPAQAVQEQLQG